MTESQRNLAILVVVAIAAVLFSGVAGAVISLQQLLNIAFTIVIVWFLIVSYRRRSGTIAMMPTLPRVVLHVAGLALAAIFITGTLPGKVTGGFLPYPPFGWSSVHPGYFWGSILLCAFGLWWSWQQRTARW